MNSFVSNQQHIGEVTPISSAQPDAIALVDYEHWLYALKDKFSVKPNIKGWIEEISTRFNLVRVDFFADFSRPEMAVELGKIRVFSTSVNDTRNANPTVQKDFSDFFILDNLYQAAYRHPNIDTIILFTGDAHFAPAVTYLSTYMKKNIVLFGVRGAISQQLRLACSEVTEVPHNYDYLLPVCKAILESMKDRLQTAPDFTFYFKPTANFVTQKFKLPYFMVVDAMNLLVEERYLEYQSIAPICDDEVRNALLPNWKKIFADKIINEDENSWRSQPSLAKAAQEFEKNGHGLVFKIPD